MNADTTIDAHKSGGASSRSSGEKRSSPVSFRTATKFGRYTILDRLGAGGMGEVWAAYDPNLDRKIALKLIHPQSDSVRQKHHRARLLREAQALAKLSHPNVVTVYDVDQIDDRLFIAMEFVEGETVAQWVERVSPGWKDILDVYLAAGRGLIAAHERRIIHRDIKPSNIVLGNDQRVRILDFGLAKGLIEEETLDDVFPDPEEDSSLHDVVLSARRTLTKTGPAIGTPGYMALEQLRAGRTAGPAADQFSLAVSLYESLYKQPPFPRSSILARLQAMEDGEIRSPPENTSVPARVYTVLHKALQPDPSDRYVSMSAFIDALEGDTYQWPWRYVWVSSIAAVLAVGIGLAWMLRGPTEPEELPCRDAAIVEDDVWNHQRQATITRAFEASNSPMAERALEHVVNETDRFKEAWMSTWKNVCEATHVQGVQSQFLLDVRMNCLAEQRQALNTYLDRFSEGNAGVVEASAGLLLSLDGPAYCETLQSPGVEPAISDPEVLSALKHAKEQLIRSRAAYVLGEFDQALTLAESVEALARQHDHQALLASSLIHQADPLAKKHRDKALEMLQDAVRVASGVGDLHVELKAWQSLFAITGQERVKTADDIALREVWLLGSESAMYKALQAHVVPNHVRGEVATARAEFHLNRGEFQDSREHAQRALGDDATSPQFIARAQKWLGLGEVMTGNYESAEQHLLRSLAFERSYLGDEHPEVASSLYALGNLYFDIGDFPRAEQAYRQAIEIASTHADADLDAWLLYRISLGLARLRQGQTDAASAELSDLRATIHDSASVAVQAVLLYAEGAVTQAQDESKAALALFEDAHRQWINTYGDSPNHWLGRMMTSMCAVAVDLDSEQALAKCDGAEALLNQYIESPTFDILSIHQARAPLYENLGRGEEADAEWAAIEELNTRFAGLRAHMAGLPTF